MKYLETTFEEYLISSKNTNIKNDYNKFINNLDGDLNKLNNLIIYGKSGIGKYSIALSIIEKYSKSNLKYERKLTIDNQKKQTYITKISDIHYEVDFELLGCNARSIWNEFYSQITDILISKKEKEGIILCKNFQNIHSELLDIFYSYIQVNNSHLKIRYIILTEQLSFIPTTIINSCDILGFKEYNKKELRKIRENKLINIKVMENEKNEKNKKYILTKINNLKDLKIGENELNNEYNILTNKITETILSVKDKKIEFFELRESLYNLLIYQLDISECIWTIVYNILNNIEINNDLFIEIQLEINRFLKHYNNNYRPIFHLEKTVLYLCNIVNEYK
jgi:ABC-type dipeptide/oligopeptide/nickel transport system ATPase component